MTKLKEFFSFPNNKLEKVGEYYEFTFFSSDELREKLINSYKNSIYSEYAPENFEKLVYKGFIIPVFSTRSMIKFFLLRPIYAFMSYTTTLGFYSQQHKKIFILIDNTSDIFGRSQENEISELCIHELIHYFSHVKPKSFLSLFIKELVNYYKYLYTMIFNVNLNEKEMAKIVTKLFIKFEIPLRNIKTTDLKKFIIDNLKDKSILNSKEFSKMLDLYVIAIKLYFEEDWACFRKPYDIIHNYHVQAFTNAFSINIGNDEICYQESIVPSEIISKISKYEFEKTKIIKLLSSL